MYALPAMIKIIPAMNVAIRLLLQINPSVEKRIAIPRKIEATMNSGPAFVTVSAQEHTRNNVNGYDDRISRKRMARH